MKNIDVLVIIAGIFGFAIPSLLTGWLVGMVSAYVINHYYKKHFLEDDTRKEK